MKLTLKGKVTNLTDYRTSREIREVSEEVMAYTRWAVRILEKDAHSRRVRIEKLLQQIEADIMRR